MSTVFPQDLTDPRKFLNYLGSFWSQIFADREAILGLTQSNSKQLEQLYVDFTDIVRASSVFGMNSIRKELVRPIFIYESKISTSSNEISFGSGIKFDDTYLVQSNATDPKLKFGGQARSVLPTFVDVDPSIKSVGNVLLNRLHNPSVTLVNGCDFIFDNNSVLFKSNPFDNSLIPRVEVPVDGSDSATDRLIVLWAVNCDIEEYSVHQKYGYVFFNSPVPDSSVELNIIQQLFRIYSGGPTIKALDSLVCAICGGPQTTEQSEVVQYIADYRDSKLVVTDMSVYTIQNTDTIRDGIVAGTVLSAGSPLTNRSLVFDSYTNPNWWTSLSGIAIRDDYCVSDISNVSFLNKEVPFNQTGVIQGKDGRVVADGNFYLAGSPRDIDKFWNSVRERSIASDIYLSETLWKDAGLTTPDGSPDYTKPLYVNPLRLFVEKIAGMSIIVVNINSSQFVNAESSLARLRQVLPVGTSLLVIIGSSASDAVSFENPDSLSQVSSPTTNNSGGYLRDVILGNQNGFPNEIKSQWMSIDEDGIPLASTSEVLSHSHSPDILPESVNIISLIKEEVSAINNPSCI